MASDYNRTTPKHSYSRRPQLRDTSKSRAMLQLKSHIVRHAINVRPHSIRKITNDSSTWRFTAATAEEINFIQRTRRKYLWYSKHGDFPLQPALLDLSTQLTKPTKRTMAAAKHIIGYAQKYLNRGVKYQESDMVLQIQSDRSHHRLPEARSVACRIFYVVNNDDPPEKWMEQLTLCAK